MLTLKRNKIHIYNIKIMKMYFLPSFNRSCFNFTFLNLWLKLLAIWRIQYTRYAYGGCQPRFSFATAPFMLICLSEIRHRPCFLVTYYRIFPKNHDHVAKVSPLTIAKAIGKMQLLPSYVVAIKSVP